MIVRSVVLTYLPPGVVENYTAALVRGVDVNKRTVTTHLQLATGPHYGQRCMFSLSLFGHILVKLRFATIECEF